MQPGEATQAVRLGVALAMLAGAAVLDLRERRVRNRFWFPFAALAAALLAVDLGYGVGAREAGLHLGVASLLCAGLYGLWHLGMFGGADAKGLMVLAWLLPWPVEPLLADPVMAFPPALDTLVNGSLAAVLLPPLFLAWNLAHGHARLPAALLGVRMDLSTARSRHVWPMQRADTGGKLSWKYWQHIGGSLDDAYDCLEAAGVRTVWVTPKLPLMLPLLAGLAAAVLWGNLPVLLLAPLL